MVLNKNYANVLIICFFTLLLLVSSSVQYSIASATQSPLQTQCLSFPNTVINGISNSNGDNDDNNSPSGLKIQVNLSNKNIADIGPLTIFIITTEGECATAEINLDSAESVGQEMQLTFEF